MPANLDDSAVSTLLKKLFSIQSKKKAMPKNVQATAQLHSSHTLIGEGNGNPLQYSCLENPRDGGACWVPFMGSHRVGHDWCNLAVAAAAAHTNKSVSQFSPSVMSDSLQPHESQHARPPCPSPTPGVHPNSCPSSRWCHPAISSSVVPFSSCPQSLPASESFPMSQLFTWGGQSIGVSALASVLPRTPRSDLL